VWICLILRIDYSILAMPLQCPQTYGSSDNLAMPALPLSNWRKATAILSFKFRIEEVGIFFPEL
jgi:hypothetical protein